MESRIYADITAAVIAELERGAMPWIKPWKADMTADRNLVSGKPYRGINRFILGLTTMAKSYSSPVWATFDQWKTAGGTVRKGEKATHICFYKPMVSRSVKDESGEERTESYSVLKTYCVFNADQVDGISFDAPKPEDKPFSAHEKAEQTIADSGAVIRHGGDAAFYAPSHDAIQMPNKTAFQDESSYYATAFHELTHWTGAKHRLNRDLSGRYGNPKYAFEELVAEMGAAFLCADHAIQGELRHAGYLQHWLTCLREDSKAIFRAAALAQKAADFIQQQKATEVAVAA
jgi:antirestriction protein ArdC